MGIYWSLNRTSHGFSLIELLITVTILGILSSISVLQYQTYKEKTYDILSKVQVRDAYTSLHASELRPIQGSGNYRVIFNADGTYEETGYAGIPVDDLRNKLLPGFQHQPDVVIWAQLWWPSNATERRRVDGYHVLVTKSSDDGCNANMGWFVASYNSGSVIEKISYPISGPCAEA